MINAQVNKLPDFTQYLSAFAPLELNVYPACVRPTVCRMRHLMRHIPHVDESVQLGAGKYGIVYKGTYPNEVGKTIICAVKVFFDERSFQREISMHWKCAGVSAVVSLHGFFAYKQENYNAIVIDYVEGEPLSKYKSQLTIPAEIQADCIEFAWQLFLFLRDIQKPAPNRKNGLIHGDLFFDNLFWSNRKLTVIDLGLMAEMGDLKDPIVQKVAARAPEIYLNQRSEVNKDSKEKAHYDFGVDMWSAGLLIHQRVTDNMFLFPHPNKSPPYGHFEISTLVYRVGLPPMSYLKTVVAAEKFFDLSDGQSVHLKPDLAKFPARKSLVESHQNTNSSPDILALLQRIFVWDPKQRITANEALKDPLFQGRALPKP